MRREFENLRKRYEKLMQKGERRIVKGYKAALEDLRELIGEAYTKYETDGKLTYAEMAKYKRMIVLYKTMDIIVQRLYKTTSKQISEVLKEDYLLGYNAMRNIVKTHAGKSIIPIVKDEVLKRAMYNDISGLRWTDRMNLHRDFAVMKIRETVTQGLKEGATYGQMSKRLNEALSGQVVQPMRIVRTEGHRVFNEAKKDSLDVAAKKGIKMTKTWITAGDERVRRIRKTKDTMDHVAMNNVTIPYEEDFKLPGGSSGFGPGMIGDANDIQCRCDWIIDFVDNSSNNINIPEYLRISNADEENKKTVTAINEELSMIPDNHKSIIDNSVKEITIVSEGYSRYDRAKGIVYILQEPVKGEVIHELGHAIETKLNLYRNERFMQVLNNGLEGASISDIIYDKESYDRPVMILQSSKFISKYQGRMYADVGIFNDDMSLNINSLGEYFSEGYREYMINPDNLRVKDKMLFDFIEEISDE